MTQARKHRGMKTQALVATWLRDRGWPFAESAGAGRSGADVTGTPDIAVEVKARAGFDPLAWIRQAVTAADGRLPFVVMRCNGQGETTIADWPCLIRLGDLTQLLHQAGYGQCADTDNDPPVDCPTCADPSNVPVGGRAQGDPMARTTEAVTR